MIRVIQSISNNDIVIEINSIKGQENVRVCASLMFMALTSDSS